MTALIIGGAGFVGQYLARHLSADCGMETHFTHLPQKSAHLPDCIPHPLNVLDADAVFALIGTLQPDYIFHLAAQSSVALSWQQPQQTAEVNIIGTVNVLEAARRSPHPPRILLVGSGEEYGYVTPADCPIPETLPLHPANVYAVTKAAAESLAAVYERAYGLWIACVRAFNHIGAGQSPQFVVSDFCKQAAEIECGLRPPVILTGNLSAKRDFTDVRDIVRAYSAILQQGQSGAIYNVGSGTAIAISEILREIQKLCRVPFEMQTDPQKFRPADMPICAADTSRLQRDTNWKPQYSLCESLQAILEDWRHQISAPHCEV